MSYFARIWTRVEIVDGDGRLVAPPVGNRLTDAARTVALAGKELTTFRVSVADDYAKVTLWQNGDGGLDDFDLLVVESDADVVLELVHDRAGTPKYTTFTVTADIPFVLTSDDVAAALLASGSATSMDQVDEISVKRNAADAAGNANVQLHLAT